MLKRSKLVLPPFQPVCIFDELVQRGTCGNCQLLASRCSLHGSLGYSGNINLGDRLLGGFVSESCNFCRLVKALWHGDLINDYKPARPQDTLVRVWESTGERLFKSYQYDERPERILLSILSDAYYPTSWRAPSSLYLYPREGMLDWCRLRSLAYMHRCHPMLGSRL